MRWSAHTSAASMKPFLFVRALTGDEVAALRAAARSHDAFARHRATVIRLSAQR